MQILKKYRKVLLLGILVFAAFLAFPPLFSKAERYQTNRQFEAYTDALFANDVRQNALNLHYTLAHPENFGITDYPVSLGSFHPSQQSSHYVACENRLQTLQSFPYQQLTKENKLTRDVLCLAYETELSPGNQYLLAEYLSPTLGSQAQLPILLAEYTFRKEQDVQDYLKLLASVDTYFEGILKFEQLKSQNGTFMSDTTADRIISQCSAFIANPEENYLDAVFREKISGLSYISEKKQLAYEKLHTKILQEQVLPAYQSLIDGLHLLKGTGKNPGGLCGFDGGKAYYEYLLKSNCGLYEPVSKIQERLLAQLQADMAECREILKRNPQTAVSTTEQSPQEILEVLQAKLLQDFPAAPAAAYEVKYVHKDLEAYLSPAFYLTPPIDTLSPNDIYINGHAQLDGIQLFTTLAHEGFPGHLYQTVTFASTDPPKIRHLLNMSGYVEGWATYIETYAYAYAAPDADQTRLEWLNRSMNLCIFSLLDTGIHYNGWTPEQTGKFLSGFGITDPAVHKEVFQVIVEDPANYLKYYMGYLHFLDLREASKKELGNDFDVREFHREVLEIGPCQFPVLEGYVLGG
ncbi:MAG: DUF885 domain-containing protein [Clostridiales bacterium]|nr:DUF885 domain-containing protein [Clostridiales bacterium]